MNTYTLIGTLVGITLLLSACSTEDHASHEAEREVLYWYDPMHPEQQFNQPGKSPFMDMDLVPRYADEVGGSDVSIAPGIQQSMNIRTSVAERGRLWRRIDTVGEVEVDESNVHHLHVRVEGWIETSSVVAKGDEVSGGQLLFTLYSPTLVNAQEEMLASLRRGDAQAVNGARDRLAALGVQQEAIAELERTRTARRALPWRAVHSGVVTTPGVREGMFVRPGDVVVEITSLSSVWVIADVFARQAEWLRIGIPGQIRTEAYPDKVWESEVSYIQPELSATTRTTRVRLPVANPDGALRPGTWAAVRLFAGPVDNVVMVPKEAVIDTGLATRVILRKGADRFEVRQVTPGLVSGDWVEILHGIEPGDEVVVSGQFLIDSEAALRSGHRRLEGAGHQH